MLGGHYTLVHMSLVPALDGKSSNVRVTLNAIPRGHLVSGVLDVTVKSDAVDGLVIGDEVDLSLRKREAGE